MKKILLLCGMAVLCAMLHASVYTFTTNAGVFKLNDQLNTISFKGIEYKITEYKDGGSEANYVFCEYNGTGKLFLLNFTNGNISEYNYIETFEWKNVASYNKAKLISGLYRNIDVYGQNNNLNDKEMELFRRTANQLIKGIENGTITMNGDGSFSDSTGKLASTGKMDKNWYGKTKTNQNNITNLVGDFAKSYIGQMPTCDSNWEQVKNPYIILKTEKSE